MWLTQLKMSKKALSHHHSNLCRKGIVKGFCKVTTQHTFCLFIWFHVLNQPRSPSGLANLFILRQFRESLTLKIQTSSLYLSHDQCGFFISPQCLLLDILLIFIFFYECSPPLDYKLYEGRVFVFLNIKQEALR